MASFVAGVYPMLLDETCFFLAIDLDKSNWQDDAIAVMETCRRLEYSGCARTVTLWKWWARLDFLRYGVASLHCAATRLACSHGDDGTAA